MNSVDNPQTAPRIELLSYVPNLPVTNEKWLRALYAKARKSFGIYATIFLTSIRHVPAMPTPPDGHEELPRHNPDMILYHRKIENCAEEIIVAETNDQKLFGLLFESMSEDHSTEPLKSTPLKNGL